MPKLKILSGQEIVKIFLVFGFSVAAQRGSHIKLVRILPDSARQTINYSQSFGIRQRDN